LGAIPDTAANYSDLYDVLSHNLKSELSNRAREYILPDRTIVEGAHGIVTGIKPLRGFALALTPHTMFWCDDHARIPLTFLPQDDQDNAMRLLKQVVISSFDTSLWVSNR
jgi:hypothetical protein